MTVEISTIAAMADRLVTTAGAGLAGARSASGVARVMAELAASAEGELASLECAGDEEQVACGPGCDGCCIVNVSVLVPEAIAIAVFLARTVPDEEMPCLKERLARQAQRVRWVEDGERPRLDIPCAFLDQRSWCLIHPVRPLLCRSISSTDPRACREVLCSGQGAVVMNLPQKILCNLLFLGLANHLQERRMDCRSLELCRMVASFLDTPALAGDFLAGKRLSFA